MCQHPYCAHVRNDTAITYGEIRAMAIICEQNEIVTGTLVLNPERISLSSVALIKLAVISVCVRSCPQKSRDLIASILLVIPFPPCWLSHYFNLNRV